MASMRRNSLVASSAVFLGLFAAVAAGGSGVFAQRQSQGVVTPNDPLWADGNIDYVGIDWYPPLGDWRSGGGIDAGKRQRLRIDVGERDAGPDDGRQREEEDQPRGSEQEEPRDGGGAGIYLDGKREQLCFRLSGAVEWGSADYDIRQRHAANCSNSCC